MKGRRAEEAGEASYRFPLSRKLRRHLEARLFPAISGEALTVSHRRPSKSRGR